MVKGLGLAFSMPEARKAQILAQLNGSTAIPVRPSAAGQVHAFDQPQVQPVPPRPVNPAQPAVIGPDYDPGNAVPVPPTDPSGAPVDPMAVPQPPVNPAAPGEPELPEMPGQTPRWAQIAAAIGHALLSADAGYRGAAMPESPLNEIRAQQDQEMQMTEFLMNAVARGWEAARNAPPEQREKILDQFRKAIARVAPDFDFDGFVEAMKTDAERTDEMAPQIAGMSPEAKAMFMARVNSMPGDPAQNAAKVLQDEEFMKGLWEFEDKRNLPALDFKLYRLRQAMKSLGMPEDVFAGMTIEEFEAMQQQLPEAVRLSPQELMTLRRHPERGKVIGLPVPGAPDADDPTMDGAAGGGAPPPPRPPGARPPPAAIYPDEEEPEAPAAPPAPGRPAAPPPRRPGPPVTSPQYWQVPRGGNAPKPQPARPGAKPPAKPAVKPATKPAQPPAGYPPGWKPRVPGQVPVQPPPSQRQPPASKPPAKPAAKPAAPPAGAKPPAKPQYQMFTAPKDMDIPGVGPVKKGEKIIYEPASGKYRRQYQAKPKA